MNSIATTQETGALGVVHLKRYWSVRMHRAPITERDVASDWARDRVLIHGLGVGIEQAARYLAVDRTFAEFETWILALNGGFIAPSRLARLNAALTDTPYDAEKMQRLIAVDAMPPVLDEAALTMWAELGLHRVA
jgi:hypothetical protein